MLSCAVRAGSTNCRRGDADMSELVRSKGAALGSASIGATALGALATGAFAIGAFAIGVLVIRRLAVRRVVIDRAVFNSLEVRDLTVHRVHGAGAAATDSLRGSPGDAEYSVTA